MGIKERKERGKQEMRENIIHAAMQMFMEEGYESTSIRKLAQKIEYSPATIYLYYKDKDELLYDVQGEAFQLLYTAFETAAVSKSPMKRLEQCCEAYIRFALSNLDLYALMFVMKSPMNAVGEHEIWSNAQNCFSFFGKCVSECIEKSLLRYSDATTATITIWSVGHGLVSLYLSCRLKILNLPEEAVEPFIQKTIKEFIRIIKLK